MGTAGFSFAIGRTGSNVLSFVATCEFGLVVTSTCFLATGGAGLVMTFGVCFFPTVGLVISCRGGFFWPPSLPFASRWGGYLSWSSSSPSLVCRPHELFIVA